MLFLTTHAFPLCYYLLAGLPGTLTVGLRLEQEDARGQEPKPSPRLYMTAEDAPAMKELEDAYGGERSFWAVQPGLCGKCVSGKDQESIMSANHEVNWSAGIYGEIQPDRIMHMLRELGAKPGQRYYDLGSGAGKTVAVAARLSGMNATGIELSKDRHVAGCRALGNLRRARSRADGAGSVELVHGSFFDYDVSDADVVFLDSVEWTGEMMQRLGQMLKGLRKGSRIVSFRDVPGSEFERAGTADTAGNWGEMQSKVFIKASEARQIPNLPLPSQATTRCSVRM